MNKTTTLILHHLKKTRGQYVSFGFIICLTALIMNIALVLAFQTFNAYDNRFQELNSADINVIIPSSQDTRELIADIREIDGVSTVEKHSGIFITATVHEFAGSDFDMNTVFYDIDEARTLNQLDVSEYRKREDDSVYIPMYLKELGGFSKDGNITYSIDGEEHTYKIGGIVSEMQYGNYGTGLIGGYFPTATYETFAKKHGEHRIAEYSLKAADNANLTKIKNAITNLLDARNMTAININDRVTAKQTRMMVCTLLIVIFLAIAAIILAVSIFLSSFRIRSAIEDELTQMGVLKAVGYTGRLLIYSVVMPYTLTGIVFTIVGAALSYTVLPDLAAILAVQSGFTYTPAFDAAALLLVIFIPVFTIILFASLSAAKIHKLEPINAIRGNKGREGAGQTLLLSVLSIGIMVLLSFAGTLLYNVSVKPDNLINTLSEESPSVIFTVRNNKMPELKKLLQRDSRVKLALEYSSASVSYADGSLVSFVCEDFQKATNNICYRGRNPTGKDEIAVGNMLAESYPIGSKIKIAASDTSAVYVVTGYIQSVNNAGKVCEMTREGYAKIGGTVNTVNVYLYDKIAGKFIEEYEGQHDSLIASSVNYEQLNENSKTMYAGIVSAVSVALFVISILMVLLVLYVMVHSMISRRRQEFGIYKAIGYTSRQLIIMTAARFIPALALSAALSAAAGMWYLPAINQFIFCQIGAMRNHFTISVWLLLVLALIFTAAAFFISVLLAAPIKKIAAASLLRE